MTLDQTAEKMGDGTSFFCFPNYVAVWPNAEDTGAQWAIARSPKNQFGEISWEYKTQSGGKFIDYNTGMIVINSDFEYPELLVQILDHQYSEEHMMFATYGIEGVTYNYDADGNPAYTDEVINFEGGILYGLSKYGILSGYYCRSGIILYPQYMGSFPAAKTTRAWDGENYVDDPSFDGSHFSSEFPTEAWDPGSQPDSPSLSFTSEENEIRSAIRTPLGTYISEAITKFVTGKLSVANDWDAFIAGLADFDIETLVDLYNEKADEYYRKLDEITAK